MMHNSFIRCQNMMICLLFVTLLFQDDIFGAAQTRLYIFQEYIRVLVNNEVPFHTVVINLENLLDCTRPTLIPGTRHIRIGSTIPPLGHTICEPLQESEALPDH